MIGQYFLERRFARGTRFVDLGPAATENSVPISTIPPSSGADVPPKSAAPNLGADS